MKGDDEAALSETAAPRHKNNKRRRRRRRRRLRSHTDREIFHVSHPLTFKWTARHRSRLELPLSGSSYQRSFLGSFTLLILRGADWSRKTLTVWSYSGNTSLGFPRLTVQSGIQRPGSSCLYRKFRFKAVNHLTGKHHETKQDSRDFPHVCSHSAEGSVFTRGGQRGIDAQFHKLTTRGHEKSQSMTCISRSKDVSSSLCPPPP